MEVLIIEENKENKPPVFTIEMTLSCDLGYGAIMKNVESIDFTDIEEFKKNVIGAEFICGIFSEESYYFEDLNELDQFEDEKIPYYDMWKWAHYYDQRFNKIYNFRSYKTFYQKDAKRYDVRITFSDEEKDNIESGIDNFFKEKGHHR